MITCISLTVLMLLSRHTEFEIFRDMVIYILSWFISVWSPWQHRRMEGTHKKSPLLNKSLSYNCLHLQLSTILG